MEDTNGELRHRRTIGSSRIGEADNPGPGLDNKQLKQLKLGEFFCRNHIQMDSKSEWCRASGYKIHNIRGDGNCLYTSLGKDLQMTGNEVRESIMANTNLYWSVIFEFDTDGKEFIKFLSGTSDRKQWG
eukprot:16432921-Heterocapsa_arctica.AAC.1